MQQIIWSNVSAPNKIEKWHIVFDLLITLFKKQSSKSRFGIANCRALTVM